MTRKLSYWYKKVFFSISFLIRFEICNCMHIIQHDCKSTVQFLQNCIYTLLRKSRTTNILLVLRKTNSFSRYFAIVHQPLHILPSPNFPTVSIRNAQKIEFQVLQPRSRADRQRKQDCISCAGQKSESAPMVAHLGQAPSSSPGDLVVDSSAIEPPLCACTQRHYRPPPPQRPLCWHLHAARAFLSSPFFRRSLIFECVQFVDVRSFLSSRPLLSIRRKLLVLRPCTIEVFGLFFSWKRFGKVREYTRWEINGFWFYFVWAKLKIGIANIIIISLTIISLYGNVKKITGKSSCQRLEDLATVQCYLYRIHTKKWPFEYFLCTLSSLSDEIFSSASSQKIENRFHREFHLFRRELSDHVE